jgi:hypothetical protein
MDLDLSWIRQGHPLVPVDSSPDRRRSAYQRAPLHSPHEICKAFVLWAQLYCLHVFAARDRFVRCDALAAQERAIMVANESHQDCFDLIVTMMTHENMMDFPLGLSSSPCDQSIASLTSLTFKVLRIPFICGKPPDLENLAGDACTISVQGPDVGVDDRTKFLESARHKFGFLTTFWAVVVVDNIGDHLETDSRTCRNLLENMS